MLHVNQLTMHCTLRRGPRAPAHTRSLAPQTDPLYTYFLLDLSHLHTLGVGQRPRRSNFILNDTAKACWDGAGILNLDFQCRDDVSELK